MRQPARRQVRPQGQRNSRPEVLLPFGNPAVIHIGRPCAQQPTPCKRGHGKRGSLSIGSTQHASAFGAANQAGSFHITGGCSLDSFLDRAGREHIRVIEQPLPNGLCGAWHEASRTIFLHDRLNQRQRRCTLCHELIHARHHDPGCGSQYGIKCERRCRRETARALISPVDYGMAETVYEGNTWMMAVELGVTVQVLMDYRQLLRDFGVCMQ